LSFHSPQHRCLERQEKLPGWKNQTEDIPRFLYWFCFPKSTSASGAEEFDSETNTWDSHLDRYFLACREALVSVHNEGTKEDGVVANDGAIAVVFRRIANTIENDIAAFPEHLIEKRWW
jgi:hypothetical protein